MLMEPAPRVHTLSRSVVESHHILITYAPAAENIQGRPDGQVNPTLAQPRHRFQVGERACASRVGGWNRGPLSQPGNKLLVNTTALPFHVHRVDEEFGTPGCQLFQVLAADRQGRELLPAVGHDEIVVAAPSAA